MSVPVGVSVFKWTSLNRSPVMTIRRHYLGGMSRGVVGMSRGRGGVPLTMWPIPWCMWCYLSRLWTDARLWKHYLLPTNESCKNNNGNNRECWVTKVSKQTSELFNCYGKCVPFACEESLPDFRVSLHCSLREILNWKKQQRMSKNSCSK